MNTQEITETENLILKMAERVDEINEIIKNAYKTNDLDKVDDMIDELHAIEERLAHKGPLC